jgi:hypothetical protein
MPKLSLRVGDIWRRSVACGGRCRRIPARGVRPSSQRIAACTSPFGGFLFGA